MSTAATWLAYPDPQQLPLRSAAAALARLHEAGVSLLVLDGGVIAATGPGAWFTPDNRLALRQRAAALAAHLKGNDR